MNENEAIERIKYRMHTAGQVAGKGGMEDLEMGIKALEEVQQYRTIGTVEECRAAMEKQTACDLDKVVEQLGKLKKAEQDRPDDCDEDGCGDGEQIYDDGRSQGRYEAFGEAIQIVKGGGVDAKTDS